MGLGAETVQAGGKAASGRAAGATSPAARPGLERLPEAILDQIIERLAAYGDDASVAALACTAPALDRAVARAEIPAYHRRGHVAQARRYGEDRALARRRAGRRRVLTLPALPGSSRVQARLDALACLHTLTLDVARAGPDTLATLAALPALTTLRLAHVDAAALAQVRRLAGLEALSLEAPIARSVGPLSALTRLTRLTLRRVPAAAVRGPAYRPPPALRAVKCAWVDGLSAADLAGLGPPATAPSVALELDAAAALVGAELGGLAGLQRLGVRAAAAGTRVPTAFWAALPPTLTRLTCRNVGPPPPDPGLWGRLSGLERLTLRGSLGPGASLAGMAGLTGLARLDLTRSAGLAGLDVLPQLPRLRALCLDACDLDCAALVTMGPVPQLTELSLRHSRLDDAAATTLVGMVGLRQLYLDDSGVGVATLRALGALPGLRHLSLAGFDFCLSARPGDGLQALRGLTQLQRLVLTGAAFHLDDAPVLATLSHLEALDLGNTLLYGSAVHVVYRGRFVTDLARQLGRLCGPLAGPTADASAPATPPGGLGGRADAGRT